MSNRSNKLSNRSNKLLRLLRHRLNRMPPPAVLALSYLALVVMGGLALMLPFAATRPLTLLEALFSSTSAVTVTGLSVIDVEHVLTFWGQLILLILVQLGGLGLMSFAVLVFSALGMPIGLTHKSYLREDLNQTSFNKLTAMVAEIFRAVLAAEIIGAMLLCLVFVPEFGLIRGGWHAIFHSISAFNNAGFSTFSEGLTRYPINPIINIVIPALFIFGGLGYLVVMDVQHRKFWRGWTLHTRLMLVGTLALIVLGVGLTAILEWNNPKTLAQFSSPISRLTVAWFSGCDYAHGGVFHHRYRRAARFDLAALHRADDHRRRPDLDGERDQGHDDDGHAAGNAGLLPPPDRDLGLRTLHRAGRGAEGDGPDRHRRHAELHQRLPDGRDP